MSTFPGIMNVRLPALNARPAAPRAKAASSPGYVFFILTTALLFLRPGDMLADLAGVPIYEFAIVMCLAFSAHRLGRLVQANSLLSNPTTLCVSGMLIAVGLSQLSHGMLGSAFQGMFQFAKLLVFYFVLLANINTPERFRKLQIWLVALITFLALLSVLHYHEIIRIPRLDALQERMAADDSDDEVIVTRLVSLGVFHDPNDFSLMLTVGALTSLYFFIERPRQLRGWSWLAPMLFLIYTMSLTQSRGGLLALLAGLFCFCAAQIGWRKSLAMAAALMPVLLVLAPGRQTSLEVGPGHSNTALDRVYLWREGLELFRESPVFGVGQGEFADRALQVAHNSFVHCFAELGFFGGSLFLGAFAFCLVTAYTDKPTVRVGVMQNVVALRPYVLAVIVAYAVGLFSLSRAYMVTTYLILGMGACYTNLASPFCGPKRFQLRPSHLVMLACGSIVFLMIIYVIVRLCFH